MRPVLQLAIFLASATLTASSFAGDSAHWAYSGHSGPEHWGELEPQFGMCAQGKNQSPVDLQAPVKAELPPLSFAYTLETREILNNGHTVQINFATGSKLAVAGRQFELKQVHFHTPSENRIEGKAFAGEAHFVHADAAGNLAVVAVMLDEGKANPALAQLLDRAPTEAGEHRALDAGRALAALLPAQKDYFEYSGSLTTPPCSEGVLWLVMKQPISISTAELETLTRAMHGPNNRPVQQLNARLVLN